MRSPFLSTVAILTLSLTGPALAEEPSETMASPEALAALEAEVQVLHRMDLELAARIEQEVGVSLARQMDEAFREIAAALSPASAPRKLVPARETAAVRFDR